MKEISLLLIGQSHSFHFFSLVNYLDNFLNELEEKKEIQNTKSMYCHLILMIGVLMKSIKKNRFKVLNIPVRKDIYEKTNFLQKFKILRERYFI